MLSLLLAASLTFTATATGVEKGTPIEFLFAGNGSDRDYESMFILDESVGELCARLEKAGLARGRATSVRDCVLWPVGWRVTFDPAPSAFIETTWPEGLSPADFVYTGGTRDEKGGVVAADEMPRAFCALYSIAQSPIVLNGVYNQGDVYNAHKAKVELKKGERRRFVLSWDERTRPAHLDIVLEPDSAAQRLREIKTAAETGDIEVTADFAPSLTVGEAIRVASALALVDSVRVKFNGRGNGHLFYRAFLPSDGWRDRQKRLAQPFELQIGEAPDGSLDRLVFIEEDWTVEGDDPKLTPRTIPFEAAAAHPKTDACFIYADKAMPLARLYAAMAKVKATSIVNWYVFVVK